jgi:hypothetical protein
MGDVRARSKNKFGGLGFKMRSRKDNWFVQNRYAMRVINTCVVCGKQGYTPQVDEPAFAGSESTVYHRFSREVLKARLHSYYQLLALDE